MNSKMMPQQRMLIASVVLTMLHFISASALAVELRDVAFSMAGGDRTDITLTFDGVPPEPTGYAIAEPARISLDLMGVSSGLASKYHSLGSGNAQNLTILETQDRTRVIIALSELVGYSTQVRGRTLQLSVGRDLDASARSVSSAAPMPVNQARSNVDNVDFRRGSEGEGRVLIALSEPNIAVDLDQVGGRIVLTMPDTTVAPALIQQLDVTDFATPVEVIEVYQQGGQAVIEVVPSGEFDYLAYQSDQGFVLEVKPVIAAVDTGGPRSKDFLYEGDKLSLNFQNIEIRAILQIVADFANLNLVASDAVVGAITLRLKDVPWDQALDIVLKTKGSR
jgi:type IV pilus assembly protein PilQ